jgi:hypothetical protein
MTELEKLKDRLDRKFSEGMKNIHFNWAPEAYGKPVEELAGGINKWLDATDAYNALPPEEKVLREFEKLYDACQVLMDEVRDRNFQTWINLPEAERNLRIKIFRTLEMPLVCCNSIRQRKEDRKKKEEECL